MRFAVSLTIVVIYFCSFAAAQTGESQILRQIGVQLPAPSIPVTLGGEQIKSAEDRFATGLASNIDLVLAQEAFATADENHISCLYANTLAKMALARASGEAESSALQYLDLAAN